MLRFYHQLFFPTLVRVDDVNFKVWPTSSSTKTTDLYKLDWSTKDKSCKRKHETWLKRQRPDLEIPLPPSLPTKYDDWINGMEFAIPTHYMKEVRESTRKGLMEWTRERNFDNRVREVCLEPAISFLRVAFELIADCTYDKKENYFYRGRDKILISGVLLYRFWMHQTNKESVWYNSGCNELDPENEAVSDFTTAIRKEYEPMLDKIYEPLENRMEFSGKGEADSAFHSPE